MVAYTERLGLSVSSEDDELDACRPNWDRLDSSYSGALWVTPGTIPDESILYEGLVVAEIGTGKVWRAIRNENGQYSQTWIKYPWLWSGGRTGTFATRGAWTRAPMGTQMVTAHCVNASASDIDPGGALVLPINAIYIYSLSVFLDPNGDTTGNRGHSVAFNDSGNPVTPEISMQKYRAPLPVQVGMYASCSAQSRYHIAGTRLVPAIINTGAATVNAESLQMLFCAVLRPVNR
jgi:hypothetical protein